VLFDLITIRFLLGYLGRPLHYFGKLAAAATLTGSTIAGALVVEKLIWGTQILTQHGPLMIAAAVLLVTGVQLLAIGLLGEMQTRHFHEATGRAPYSVSRVLPSKYSNVLADGRSS